MQHISLRLLRYCILLYMRTYTDFVYHTGSEAYQRRNKVWLFWRHQLKITDQATYVWDELNAQQVWVILSGLYA